MHKMLFMSDLIIASGVGWDMILWESERTETIMVVEASGPELA